MQPTPAKTKPSGVLIGLDVGRARIGVARVHMAVRLPEPLGVVEAGNAMFEKLVQTAALEDAVAFVVGLPLNSDHTDSPQAAFTRTFVEQLSVVSKLPVILQEEIGTSREAETRLAAAKKRFGKAEVDALAATLILERYVAES